jgi:hypothetical protein
MSPVRAMAVGVLAVCIALACARMLAAADGPAVPAKPYPARGYLGRALFPYYTSSTSINTDDRAVFRPSWMNLSNDLWDTGKDTSAWHSRLDLREAWFSYAFDYTQRFAAVTGKGAARRHVSEVQWARVMLGGNWPAKFGDFGLSVGAGLLDDDGAFNARGGFHTEATATVWPVWPVALGARADLGLYEGGAATVDWSVEMRLQLWRAAFLTVGWRDVSMSGVGAGGGFPDTRAAESRGLYLGFTFTFSGFTTMFDRPAAESGNGLLGLIGG